MAIVNKKGSINIDGLDQDPILMPNSKTSKGGIMYQTDTLEVEAADDDTSTYTVGRLPSNAVISNASEFSNDAITGGTDYDLGFYNIDGTVILATALATALDLSSAGSTKLLSSVDIDKRGQEVWQLAGLTEDPHTLIDVVFTANTVGTADGTISSDLYFTQ